MFSKMVLTPIFAACLILGCYPSYGQAAAPVTTAADLYKQASPSVVLIETFDSKGECSKGQRVPRKRGRRHPEKLPRHRPHKTSDRETRKRGRLRHCHGFGNR